jgi:hypothetical protein
MDAPFWPRLVKKQEIMLGKKKSTFSSFFSAFGILFISDHNCVYSEQKREVLCILISEQQPVLR